MGGLLDEKLEDTAFYNEWTGGAMSASRVRILTTEFLGEAWERVQARLDILEIFKKKGWGFVVSDENDKCVRMPQLEGYTWSMADLNKDDVVEAPDDDDDDAPEELATAEEEHDSGDECDEGNDSSDGEEEEVDPGPWQDKDPWVATSEPTPPKAKLHIAHKFMTDVGWEVGKIVGKSRGVWAVKYPTDRQQYLHDLNIEDYGSVWVVVEKM